jgi:hypothetical protein
MTNENGGAGAYHLLVRSLLNSAIGSEGLLDARSNRSTLGWLGGLPRFGFPFPGRPVPCAFFGRPRFLLILKSREGTSASY